MVIPMLDEDEYSKVMAAKERVWKEQEKYISGELTNFKQALDGAILNAYNGITGFNESNINAVFHHRISLYGPPCGNCGKPLRTPLAKFCAACGWRPVIN